MNSAVADLDEGADRRAFVRRSGLLKPMLVHDRPSEEKRYQAGIWLPAVTGFGFS